MSQKKTMIVAMLVSLLILAAAVAAGHVILSQSPGQIKLSATRFDFGTIPNTGPVSHVFQVQNVGHGPLEISGVSTSCGCTTAEIGSQHLERGEITDLTVTYDPLVHGGATGRFMRLVYIRSDDPKTPEASLTIQVTVVQS